MDVFVLAAGVETFRIPTKNDMPERHRGRRPKPRHPPPQIPADKSAMRFNNPPHDGSTSTRDDAHEDQSQSPGGHWCDPDISNHSPAIAHEMLRHESISIETVSKKQSGVPDKSYAPAANPMRRRLKTLHRVVSSATGLPGAFREGLGRCGPA